jgi:hypothetical protein
LSVKIPTHEHLISNHIVYNYGKNQISATIYIEANYNNILLSLPSNYRVFPPDNKSYLTIEPGKFKDYVVTYDFPIDTSILVKCITERGNKIDKYYSI